VSSALVSIIAPLQKAFGGVVRAQVTAMMGASSAGVSGVGELEKQTLEAQRAQAAASIDVSEQEIRVLDSRLELLDAQQKVLGGK